MPFAARELRPVHMGSLQEFIAKRRAEGVKTKTLNAALGVVRRILNLAASERRGASCRAQSAGEIRCRKRARFASDSRVRARAEKGQLATVTKMYNTAWRSARERAAKTWAERHGEPAPEGFRNVRVHDLKHTFGRRLRAAGVTFADRQDLLGHKSGRITTHYSQAELSNLIAAAEEVCETESRNRMASPSCERVSA